MMTFGVAIPLLLTAFALGYGIATRKTNILLERENKKLRGLVERVDKTSRNLLGRMVLYRAASGTGYVSLVTHQMVDSVRLRCFTHATEQDFTADNVKADWYELI